KFESTRRPSKTLISRCWLGNLGISFGLAVTVGATMGAGILRTPAEVARLSSNSWLFAGVWVADGLYALLCVPSFAELGTMIRSAGGLYVFANRALGRYAGFVVGWSDWLATCANITIGTTLIGELLEAVFPALK